MKNKAKLIFIAFLLLLFIVGDCALFYFKIYDYLLIIGLLTIMVLVFLILEIKKSRMDDNQRYIYLVNKTIKIYNPILVETKNIPELKTKSLLNVKVMSDLVNAQYEIKKPIYYIKSDDSTCFYLMDNDVVLVYFIKIYEDVEASLETKFNNKSKGRIVDTEVL